MSPSCRALVLPDIPARVHVISILRVTLGAKNTECCVHKYHTLSLAVSFPENLGIRNKSSPVAHCLVHLSVVTLCICLDLVLLGGFSLPSSCGFGVQQEERFIKGLGENVNMGCRSSCGTSVADRGGGQCDLTSCRGSFCPWISVIRL